MLALQIVALDDGSVLLLDVAAADSTSGSPAGVLGAGELVDFVVTAVAGGITFDVLKRVAAQLPRRKLAAPSTADAVRDGVTEYLLRSGYARVIVEELRQVGARGWTVRGTADDATFHALSDASGRVIHVRIG